MVKVCNCIKLISCVMFWKNKTKQKSQNINLNIAVPMHVFNQHLWKIPLESKVTQFI